MLTRKGVERAVGYTLAGAGLAFTLACGFGGSAGTPLVSENPVPASTHTPESAVPEPCKQLEKDSPLVAKCIGLIKYLKTAGIPIGSFERNLLDRQNATYAVEIASKDAPVVGRVYSSPENGLSLRIPLRTRIYPDDESRETELGIEHSLPPTSISEIRFNFRVRVEQGASPRERKMWAATQKADAQNPQQDWLFNQEWFEPVESRAGEGRVAFMLTFLSQAK